MERNIFLDLNENTLMQKLNKITQKDKEDINDNNYTIIEKIFEKIKEINLEKNFERFFDTFAKDEKNEEFEESYFI